MNGFHDKVTAAILAGGLGTRLRSVIADRPKCLAPVCGRPFILHLLDQLAGAGVEEIVLMTGHLAAQVEEVLGDNYAGMRVRYSLEPSPLGTAGAIRHALPMLPHSPFLLLNADSYCDVDLRNFQRQHKTRISMVLTHVVDASRFGQVRMDSHGNVVDFEEKGAAREPGWINAGIALVDRSLFEELPHLTPISMERELLPTWTREGWVHGYCSRGRFLDIGTPLSYALAESFFQRSPVST